VSGFVIRTQAKTPTYATKNALVADTPWTESPEKAFIAKKRESAERVCHKLKEQYPRAGLYVADAPVGVYVVRNHNTGLYLRGPNEAVCTGSYFKEAHQFATKEEALEVTKGQSAREVVHVTWALKWVDPTWVDHKPWLVSTNLVADVHRDGAHSKEAHRFASREEVQEWLAAHPCVRKEEHSSGYRAVRLMRVVKP
jgi:hypothetical protein